MEKQKIRVGIIGLKPEVSWASMAHVPALKSLESYFEIKGVANSNLASSEAAAKVLGIPLAFANAEELIHSSEIDLVTVTITVTQHLKVVKAALEAKKHVYCEAPLGKTLAEAQEMAELAKIAKANGVVAVVGLQARMAPEILYLKQQIAEGLIGTVLSSSIQGWGANWGATASHIERLGYLLDKTNGATMLTIPVGHTLAAVCDVLGDVSEISAQLDTRQPEVTSLDDGSKLKMTAPDQIIALGRFKEGVPFSLHYQGGMPNGGLGFCWDILGTEGNVRVTAPFGHSQMAQLSLAKAKPGTGAFEELAVPAEFKEGVEIDTLPGNVARGYARMAKDIFDGSSLASSFDDGVRVQKVIDAIEQASELGKVIRL